MKLFELYLMALALLAGRAAADNQEYYSGEFIISVRPPGAAKVVPASKLGQTRVRSVRQC